MQIAIQCRDFDPTVALRDYARKRLACCLTGLAEAA